MNENSRYSQNKYERITLQQKGEKMYKYVDDLKSRAEAGDKEAEAKYEKIMECLKTIDDDRVANCIILMKRYIPELWNQSALLLKKYIVDESRSLDFLSKDEVELIEFLREYLKNEGDNRH